MLHEAFGESKSVLAWSKDPRCVVSRTMLRVRLSKGMGMEEALTTEGVWRPGKFYEAFGESKTLVEWGRDPRCAVPYARLQNRVVSDGMDFMKALTTPVGEVVPGRRYSVDGVDLPLKEWAEQLGLSAGALHARIHRLGWSVDEAVSTGSVRGSSRLERQMADYIGSLGVNVETNVGGLIAHKELDAFCPDQQVAFEFNGLYWHSEAHRSRTYHYEKWKECKDAGITLIQVWEDEWLEHGDAVRSMIAHKLGVGGGRRVYARKTVVDLAVPSGEAAGFLDRHHIQGHVGSSVRIGLRDGGDLVALGCFAASSDTPWTMTRFATSVSVPGGFSRVLKAFRRSHDGQIKTFADLCVSDGGLYERNGFVMTHLLPPDYSYVVGPTRAHKFNFRKERFERDPDLAFLPDLPERELARLNGLWRVWDAGKIRYVVGEGPISTTLDEDDQVGEESDLLVPVKKKQQRRGRVDLIVGILESRPGPWSTTEVLERLESMGSAPAGVQRRKSVRAALGRLAEADDIRRVDSDHWQA